MIIEMDSQFKTFPQEEYVERIAKLQNEMKKEGVDVLLLSTPENIYYTTGYRSWYLSSLFRPVFSVVPSEGEPAIIMRILEKSTVKFTSWLPEENIIVTGTKSRNLGRIDAEDHVEAVHMAISKLSPNAKTVGLEKGEGSSFFWSINILEDIINYNKNYEYIHGALCFQRSRMIKSNWEITQMRTAARITEKAVLDTFASVIPNKTTEKDVSRMIASKMTENGIDKISYLTVTSGLQKYTTLNAYSTDRVIQYGELLLVDISGHYNGYASDITRMMYVGNEIPVDIQSMADVSNDCVLAGKEFIKPGASVSQLNITIEDVIRKSPYSDYLIHSSGHSVGLNVVEYPMISDSSNVLLEPGMILAVENGVYPFDQEDGAENMHLAFRMEEEVLVTEDGSEWITGPTKSLYCLRDFI